MYENKSVTLGAKSHWDLCVSGELVLLAYHRCEADGKRVPAGYSQTEREYECPDCGAKKVSRQFSVFAAVGAGEGSSPSFKPAGGGGCCGGSCGCGH